MLRNFWYEVRHSMIKSASIVRNLSKNHTFRTIASILIDTQSRFPANLTILIIQLQEARIKPIRYNDSVIYLQLYPNGIILAQQFVVFIRGIFYSIIHKAHETITLMIAVAFHRLCTNRLIEQFCIQNRFAFICILD